MNKQQMPTLRFPEFSQNWKKITLGNKTFKVGSGVTPKGGSQVYTDDGVLFIRSQNVENNTLSLDDITFIPEEIHQKMDGSQVEPFDILLNITGASIGRSCVVPESIEEANVNQHVCIIRLKENNDPRFFQSVLASEKGDQLIYKHQAGGGREGLNFANIRSFRFHVPDFKEQQKIADFLSSIDQKIQQLRRKKELLEEYKKGVMQQLFSQEIRFKDENGEGFPDWERKQLDKLGSFSKGKGIAKKDIKEDGTYKCIRYGELYTDYNEMISDVKSKTNLPEGKLVFSKSNDVLIPSSGETHIDIATASCVLEDGIALGGDINIFRTKQNGVFISYYLKTAYKHQIASLAQGNSVVHLYSKQLKSLEILLPSKTEQQKIVEFLQNIDKNITLVEAKIERFQTFKKGLLQQMFV